MCIPFSSFLYSPQLLCPLDMIIFIVVLVSSILLVTTQVHLACCVLRFYFRRSSLALRHANEQCCKSNQRHQMLLFIQELCHLVILICCGFRISRVVLLTIPQVSTSCSVHNITTVLMADTPVCICYHWYFMAVLRKFWFCSQSSCDSLHKVLLQYCM